MKGHDFLTQAIRIVKIEAIKDKICRRFMSGCKSALHIVGRESGYNLYAQNRTSGAIGLFQFYPASKLRCKLSDVDCQIEAGYQYITTRFGSADKAWDFWQANQWY